MKPRRRGTFIVVAAVAAMPALSAAQAPVASFDELNTRLKVGDTVWVTEAQGREIQGKIQRITPDAVTLNGSRTFGARDVSLVRYREHDSLKNGLLIGLGIGGGLGLAWCLAAATDASPRTGTRVECIEGFTIYIPLGTVLGLVVDKTIPGKMRIAYRAAGAPVASNGGRLSPWSNVTPGAKGIAVSFFF